jgi:hypothetical protein
MSSLGLQLSRRVFFFFFFPSQGQVFLAVSFCEYISHSPRVEPSGVPASWVSVGFETYTATIGNSVSPAESSQGKNSFGTGLPPEVLAFSLVFGLWEIFLFVLAQQCVYTFFVTVLGIEFRALCLLGKCSSIWAIPPSPFCFEKKKLLASMLIIQYFLVRTP